MVESMTARQLKEELEKLKIDYSDCVEKEDLVKKLKKGLLAKREDQVWSARMSKARNDCAVRCSIPNQQQILRSVEGHTQLQSDITMTRWPLASSKFVYNPLGDSSQSNVIAGTEPQILCNKSISFLRMNQAALALESALASITKFPAFVKVMRGRGEEKGEKGVEIRWSKKAKDRSGDDQGYLRAAAAQSSLGRHSAALLLLDTGIEILQRDHDVREEVGLPVTCIAFLGWPSQSFTPESGPSAKKVYEDMVALRKVCNLLRCCCIVLPVMTECAGIEHIARRHGDFVRSITVIRQLGR
eukprot:749633-Hanusia_phi.AAC.1